ncbi:MAG TPA: bifunctional metallophosphatase/5'-nucleotidase [Bacteroidia bacterium]|nr:bifunctional metallophosphatase/5'-nucleotidase [Bacteroidia bacterium]
MKSPKMISKLLLGCAMASTLLVVACTPKNVQNSASASKAQRTVEFVILQFNDVYEISPLDNGKVGGMARVATVKHQLEQTGLPVITVLDGDYLSPSLLGTLSCSFPTGKERVNGRHMVEVLNALGTDYVTFGNHEFDLKEPDLLARNNESQFRIISSNCRHVVNKVASRFNQGDQAVPDFLVHAIPNPHGDTLRLGLIGVTLEFTRQDYLQYLDPYQASKDAFEQASKVSDVVFGITHLSMDQDDTLARKVPGMPLLMGGHEHQNMTRKVGDSFIAKADANVKTLYLHWCTWDIDTQKMKVWSQLMPITDAIPADPAVDAIVRKWETFGDQCMKDQGYEPYDSIGFAFAPLDGRDGSMRTGQTNLGFLLCDAFKKADAQSDLAIMNSGSVRLDDQISGFVVQKHILATLPFGGKLQHGNVKGQDLRRLLDTGLSPALDKSGAHLQYSSNVTRSSSGYTINGQLLDDNKAYVLTLPGFLAGGGEKSLDFIKGIATWSDIALAPSTAGGPNKNDVRDIAIWYMKQSGQMTAIRAMMKK